MRRCAVCAGGHSGLLVRAWTSGGHCVAMPRVCLKLEQAARLAPWGGTYRVRALRGGNSREAAAQGVKRRSGEGTEGRTAGPGVPRAPRAGRRENGRPGSLPEEARGTLGRVVCGGGGRVGGGVPFCPGAGGAWRGAAWPAPF